MLCIQPSLERQLCFFRRRQSGMLPLAFVRNAVIRRLVLNISLRMAALGKLSECFCSRSEGRLSARSGSQLRKSIDRFGLRAAICNAASSVFAIPRKRSFVRRGYYPSSRWLGQNPDVQLLEAASGSSGVERLHRAHSGYPPKAGNCFPGARPSVAAVKLKTHLAFGSYQTDCPIIRQPARVCNIVLVNTGFLNLFFFNDRGLIDAKRTFSARGKRPASTGELWLPNHLFRVAHLSTFWFIGNSATLSAT